MYRKQPKQIQHFSFYFKRAYPSGQRYQASAARQIVFQLNQAIMLINCHNDTQRACRIEEICSTGAFQRGRLSVTRRCALTSAVQTPELSWTKAKVLMRDHRHQRRRVARAPESRGEQRREKTMLRRCLLRPHLIGGIRALSSASPTWARVGQPVAI